jgi:hypothetical protein
MHSGVGLIRRVTSFRGTEQRWFKSSHSSADGSCIEVKFDDGMIMVRDSKDKRTDQPMLSIATPEWHAFLTAVTHRKIG